MMSEVNKNKQVLFRVSDEEYECLQGKADKFKFRSMSEYCRYAALNTNDISLSDKEKHEHDWSGDNIKDMINIMADPNVFRKYCKVVHPALGLIDFKEFRYQKEMLQTMKANSHVLINMPRQMGTTIISSCYLLHQAMFSTGSVNVYIVSNKKANAGHILENMKTMYNYLPEKYKLPICKMSTDEIAFDHGSSVKVFAASKNAFRGISGKSIFYIDNCGFINEDTAEQMIQSILPVKDDSQYIIASTGGNTGYFATLWNKYEDDKDILPVVKEAIDKIKKTTEHITKSGLVTKYAKINYSYSEKFEEEADYEAFKKKFTEDCGSNAWDREYECKAFKSKKTAKDIIGMYDKMMVDNGEKRELQSQVIKKMQENDSTYIVDLIREQESMKSSIDDMKTMIQELIRKTN
jgi:hypothetical protein